MEIEMEDAPKWPLGTKHSVYGKCIAMGYFGNEDAGEHYRWFIDIHGNVAMMPLCALTGDSNEPNSFTN